MRLTVLMPVYNGARYLDESIESVLGQQFDDFELLIVDDGSIDTTPELLAKWEARDPRIVVLRLERNGGATRALNAGLAVARGEYLARQDADDISLPGRFARQAAALDAHPDAVWVAIGRLWIDEQGKTIGAAPYLLASPEVMRFILHFAPLATGVPGQTMFRTAAARAVGGWDEEYRVAQGWEFISRLSKQGSLLALPELGMKYRVHRQRTSAQFHREQLDNATRITRTMLSALLGRDVTEEEAAASASVWFLQSPSGAASTAARLLREALSRFPLSPRERAAVRRVARSRFVRTAAFHAARKRPLEAVRHLFEAIRL